MTSLEPAGSPEGSQPSSQGEQQDVTSPEESKLRRLARAYRGFTLKDHIGSTSAVISALAAVSVGGYAIYTNLQSLRMMELQKAQFAAGQYQQYQGSIALAWKTIGDANGKAFELGQSTSLYYLAASDELDGNVTLNGSSLDLVTWKSWKTTSASTARAGVSMFSLAASAFCKTEISKSINRAYAPRVNLSYSLLRDAKLSGTFFNDDFLAADLQGSRLVDLRAEHARFAGTDLRRAIVVGGTYHQADFQGSDLRGIRTERGATGAGYDYNADQWYGSYDVGGFIDPDGIVWPQLFEPNIGVNDALKTIGRKGAFADGATYPVDFSRANFSGADLRGARMENSNITQAQINQACVDGTTKLPPGRIAIRPCEFPLLHSEKLAAIRAPMRAHPLQRICSEHSPPIE